MTPTYKLFTSTQKCSIHPILVPQRPTTLNLWLNMSKWSMVLAVSKLSSEIGFTFEVINLYKEPLLIVL